MTVKKFVDDGGELRLYDGRDILLLQKVYDKYVIYNESHESKIDCDFIVFDDAFAYLNTDRREANEN